MVFPPRRMESYCWNVGWIGSHVPDVGILNRLFAIEPSQKLVQRLDGEPEPTILGNRFSTELQDEIPVIALPER